jgi:TatD DNase family protein
VLFDTHAHYDDQKYNEDRDEAIKRAFDSGVKHIINVSVDVPSSIECIEIAEKYDFIYSAIGFHPQNVERADDNTIEALFNIAQNKKVVAIGEVGLDYFYPEPPRDLQKLWFVKQVDLAKTLNMPLIIHDRDAHQDTISIIKNENAKQVGGVFHCFSGSIETAREILKHEFYISFTGVVTFKNAKSILEVVKSIPDDRLLIETDCPYLSPEPNRGKRNESSFIGYTAEKIAELRGTTRESLEMTTFENAKRLFGI